MAKEYLVEVDGCDDATVLIIQATDAEFAVIDALASRVAEASKYVCQPTMDIREATEDDKRRLKDE